MLLEVWYCLQTENLYHQMNEFSNLLHFDKWNQIIRNKWSYMTSNVNQIVNEYKKWNKYNLTDLHRMMRAMGLNYRVTDDSAFGLNLLSSIPLLLSVKMSYPPSLLSSFLSGHLQRVFSSLRSRTVGKTTVKLNREKQKANTDWQPWSIKVHTEC